MKRPMGVWLAAITLAAMAGVAFGGSVYTNVAGPPGGEEDHQTIIETVYGLSVTQDADGVSWSGAGFKATRIADTGGSAALALLQPDVASGPFDDQSWHDGVAAFTAEAKYAAYNQTFGFAYNGDVGWQELLRVSGSGFGVTTNATGAGTQLGDTSMAMFSQAPLHWVRAGQDGTWTDNLASSRIGDNPDEMDHMVTYMIEDTRLGPVNGTTWLVFWEDILGCGSDWDYNDLVVEFQVEGGGGVIIPEPVTVLSLFGGVSLLSRYVRRRTAA